MVLGSCCRFCASGTNLMLYTAPAPLGPYTVRRELNPVVDPESGALAIPSQQQGVTVIRGGPGQSNLSLQLMWSGERWQQAPDGRKEHDPQAWVPIAFGAGGLMEPLSFVQTWSPGP